MTAAFFRGRSRRVAAAFGAVTFGVVALSACDKPTPLTTLTADKSEVHSEAACYDGKGGIEQSDIADCLGKGGKTLKVPADGLLHLGVDPKVAKKGWFVASGTQRSDVSTRTYRTLSAASFLQQGTDEAKISIFMVGDKKTYGVWNYTLKNDN
ncbi:DUF2771 domain-containing protein [Streptomyces sp. CA-181903]|uniref:DUF2771 domain-containing protein n=1 Tax=Streptomyces sp. CA-181903 TaxID=3240055 RepID=UPI003D8F8A72